MFFYDFLRKNLFLALGLFYTQNYSIAIFEGVFPL